MLPWGQSFAIYLRIRNARKFAKAKTYLVEPFPDRWGTAERTATTLSTYQFT